MSQYSSWLAEHRIGLHHTYYAVQDTFGMRGSLNLQTAVSALYPWVAWKFLPLWNCR